MKNFNKEIKITITANEIATKLLGEMNPEFKHREMVVEAIIGSANERILSNIYNTLNGFTLDINFKVGDKLVQNEKGSLTARMYKKDETGAIVLINPEKEYIKITNAEVIEIDEYADKKINIRFSYMLSNGNETVKEEWVNHLFWDLEQLDSPFAQLKNTDEIIRDTMLGKHQA